MLIAETAHQSAAGAGDLRGIEGQILLLCHLDGDLHEVGEECRAAERSPAHAQSAEHLRFVTDADLPQLYPCAENGGEILHQFPEIDPDLRGKIEEELAVVEGVFRLDELHVQSMVAYLLLTDGERLRFELLVCLVPFPVRVCGDPYNGAQRRDDFGMGDHLIAGRDKAVFGSPCGFHDHAVAFLHHGIARREIIDLSRVLEADTDDLHFFRHILHCVRRVIFYIAVHTYQKSFPVKVTVSWK